MKGSNQIKCTQIEHRTQNGILVDDIDNNIITRSSTILLTRNPDCELEVL
jgi:hypothetical protein